MLNLLTIKTTVAQDIDKTLTCGCPFQSNEFAEVMEAEISEKTPRAFTKQFGFRADTLQETHRKTIPRSTRMHIKNHQCPLQHIQHHPRCFHRSQRHSSSEIDIAKSCAPTKSTPTPTEHYSQFGVLVQVVQ